MLQGGYIDEMMAKWLSLTPNPPRIPVFYTLTKDSQTDTCQETYNIGVRWPYRTNIIFCCPPHSAYSTNTRRLSKRYNRLY